MSNRPRLAHLSGPTATIQNIPPLVTSNKAREQHGLPTRRRNQAVPARFDALRPQRLATPVTVYVEQYSAHPLEKDAAELYGPPDGYVSPCGDFSPERLDGHDRPVYRIDLKPEDGLYPLPYMAFQADGRPWDEQGCEPNADESRTRQGFFPDASRSFEEIDRLGIAPDGLANSISDLADVDFFRVLPPGGFTKGLPADCRSDLGAGPVPPERRGRDFFAYLPPHLSTLAPRPALAMITNRVQAILSSGQYLGALWTQGSPEIEETAYWFNLLIDSHVPIACAAAQRPQGQLSADGPQNILDSVRYLTSRVWADSADRNRLGTLVIQDQQLFAAREVAKVDARPGGYVASGGHGGILGQVIRDGRVVVTYLPAYRHTCNSAVRRSQLPSEVTAVRAVSGGLQQVVVQIKSKAGDLLENAIPVVSIIKDGGYTGMDWGDKPSLELDLEATIRHKLEIGRLTGLVVEGLVPYGHMTSRARQQLIFQAIFSGLPVVQVGRGNSEGFANIHPFIIAGSNLTATKARLLLMASLMRLGSLPVAADPTRPSSEESAATAQAVVAYQEIFNTH